MRALFAAFLSIVIGCSAAPSRPPPAPSPPRAAVVASAEIAGPDVVSPPEASPPEALPPAGLEGGPIEIEALTRFRDGGALCADHIARSARALRESGGWAHLHPTLPSCHEVTLPVPFRGDATFRGARAFALGSGIDAEERLAVRLAGGLALTPVSWGYSNIHASLFAPLPGTLESLQVTDGALVAVVGRTDGRSMRDARGEAGPLELVLVRSVIVCRAAEALACRAYFPDAGAPVLGMKRRPWEATTPWSALAWDKAPSFTFSPSGRLIVGE